MIPRRPVTDALLALLRTSGLPIGDGIAPDPPRQQYGVLESLGKPPPDGSPFRPEREYYFEYRLRSVGVDQASIGEGHTNQRMDAEAVDDRLMAKVFDRSVPLQGITWRVTERYWLGGGDDREGPTTNVISDIRLKVVAR